MLIRVTSEDFERAREVLPEDAFQWMHQEFAANFSLQRAFPEAQQIKVDHFGIRIDGRPFRRPLALYLRRKPYVFRLSQSWFLVRLMDLAGFFIRIE